MTGDPEYDPLDNDERDALAATGRAIASVVPMFGGVIGELIAQGLPAQRVDRIAKYIRALETRVAALEGDWAKIVSDPERVDLIEEGGFQAARATNKKRIEQIAELVANGVSTDEADIIRRKRLARLLRELDDDELILLNAYGQSHGGTSAVWNFLKRPDPAHLQSSIAEIDADKLFDAGREHLLRLGLLGKKYRAPRRGEAPTFDTRKGDYEHNVEVSYLGRMLLRSIGQPSPIDMPDS